MFKMFCLMVKQSFVYILLEDGIDSAWTTATKNMSPRDLAKWRRNLFSIYVGHLPFDITKVSF